MNMTKFKGRQDAGYVAVLKEIRRILECLKGEERIVSSLRREEDLGVKT